MGRGSSKGGGLTLGGSYGTITEKKVNALIEKGASRWTKGDKDRLYLNDAAHDMLGLNAVWRQNGKLDSASIKGESLSKTEAFRVMEAYEKAFIDLKTGKVTLGNAGTRFDDAFFNEINSKWRKKPRASK